MLHSLKNRRKSPKRVLALSDLEQANRPSNSLSSCQLAAHALVIDRRRSRQGIGRGWVDSLIKRLDDDRYAIKVSAGEKLGLK